MTEPSADAVAFDRFLDASSPEIAAAARALRLAIHQALPGGVEWFDPSDGVLGIGTGRSIGAMLFGIVTHSAHVNLQLVDGVDLSNPHGRIEGSGKRARHIKVRSEADATAPWVRDAIAAQVAHRLSATR